MKLENIKVKKLNIFDNPDGNVLRGIRNYQSDIKFGELYFSWINSNSVKGWKMNLTSSSKFIVPYGSVKFVFFSSNDFSMFREELIGETNYSLIEIPSNIWYGFKGVSSKSSLIFNLLEDIHNKDNMMDKKINEIKYNW